MLADELETLVAVGGAVDGEAGLRQHGGQEGPDVLLVLDHDRDACCFHRCTFWRRRVGTPAPGRRSGYPRRRLRRSAACQAFRAGLQGLRRPATAQRGGDGGSPATLRRTPHPERGFTRRRETASHAAARARATVRGGNHPRACRPTVSEMVRTAQPPGSARRAVGRATGQRMVPRRPFIAHPPQGTAVAGPSPSGGSDASRGPSSDPQVALKKPPRFRTADAAASVSASAMASSNHASRRAHRRHRLGKVHDRPPPRRSRRRRRRRGPDRARRAAARLAGARRDRRRVRRADAAARRLAGSRGARRRGVRRSRRGETAERDRAPGGARGVGAAVRRGVRGPIRAPSSSTTCRCSSRRGRTIRGSSSSWRTPPPTCGGDVSSSCAA